MMIVSIVLGSCIASFLNVVSLRYVNKEDFVFARSHCPACGHRLSFFDLIPIVSYLFLRGKCSYCKKRISRRYLAVEVIGAVLSYFSYSYLEAVEYIFVFCMFLMALIDYDSFEIPYMLMFVLSGLNVLMALKHVLTAIDVLGGMVIISLPLLLIFFISKGFGLGDVIITAICGIGFGYKLSIAAFVLSLLAGCFQALLIIVRGKGSIKSTMAFGPALFLGYSVVLLFRIEILQLWSLYF